MDVTLLVPGARDNGLAYGVMNFASPPIPFGLGYRIPLRMREFRNHLAHQSLRIARERRISAIAFCHSDVATLADSLIGRWAGRAEAYAWDAVFTPLPGRYLRLMAQPATRPQRIT